MSPSSPDFWLSSSHFHMGFGGGGEIRSMMGDGKATIMNDHMPPNDSVKQVRRRTGTGDGEERLKC